MRSPIHAATRLCIVILSALILLGALGLKGEYYLKAAAGAGRQDQLLFLFVAALFCAAVPLLWNHDFGMWGDWNLATCYAAPANIFCWAALLSAVDHQTEPSREYLNLALPVLIIQCVGYVNVLLFLR